MYQNDAELVKRCLTGNQIAWNEFVDRYAKLVYAIALRHGLSGSDLDDLFQNVFTIIFRHLKSLRDTKLVAAWIIRITTRECWHFHRHGPEFVELDESLSADDHHMDEDLELYEYQHIVRTALNQLEPRCRDLLRALFFESDRPDYAKIAKRFNMPLGSIGPTRARCFAKLEAILKEMEVDLSRWQIPKK
jgi:RNA polymerase sigma factor (sigma-70 family)